MSRKPDSFTQLDGAVVSNFTLCTVQLSSSGFENQALGILTAMHTLIRP